MGGRRPFLAFLEGLKNGLNKAKTEATGYNSKYTHFFVKKNSFKKLTPSGRRQFRVTLFQFLSIKKQIKKPVMRPM